MTHHLLNLGRPLFTVLITLVSVLGSVLITTGLFALRGEPLEPIGWYAAIFAPLIISPAVSWFMLGMLYKIHELEQEMRGLATYDALSALYNRRYFLVCMDNYLKLADRIEQIVAVVFMDIDHFKRINDTFGHDAGDAVIREVAALIKAGIRSSDIACRYGGEEFVVGLLGIDREDVFELAESLRKRVESTPILVGGRTIAVTMSAGVSVRQAGDNLAIEALITRADKALYQSKQNGRNRTTLHMADTLVSVPTTGQ